MALSSDLKKQQIGAEELDELLESIEKLLERTKVLYEQYFMGIQKIAPMQLHRDIERKVRELTQQQIRNTALRFRFTTICQKFGSYNTYWKRTLREIEQGKYVRDLARVKRKADQQGEELPEELLVKLPKLVQDRIRRDRAKLAERARREEERHAERPAPEATPAPASPAAEHEISEEEAESLFGEGDLDLDGLFTALTAAEMEASAKPADPPPEPPAAAKDAPAPPTTPERAARPSQPGAKIVSIPLPRGALPTRPIAASSGFRVPPPPGATRAGTAPPPPREEPANRVPPIRIVPARPEPEPKPAAPEPKPEPAAQARPEPAAQARPEPAVHARPEPRPASSTRPEPRGEPRARTQPPSRPGPPLPPGMDDKQCRELYARYLKARQLVGEKNDDVTYEKLVVSLGKQAAAIMSEHGARAVEFHVVVRGDKVVLKAKPLKSDK